MPASSVTMDTKGSMIPTSSAVQIGRFPAMVQIRVRGKPCDVTATTRMLCQLADVVRVNGPIAADNGVIMNYLTALPPANACQHPTADPDGRHPADGGLVVETGRCRECGELVVRVLAERDGVLAGVGAWSPLDHATSQPFSV